MSGPEITREEAERSAAAHVPMPGMEDTCRACGMQWPCLDGKRVRTVVALYDRLDGWQSPEEAATRRAFYELTVAQRDGAWREVEGLHHQRDTLTEIHEGVCEANAAMRECIDKVKAGCSVCPVHEACWYDGDHFGMTEAQRQAMHGG